MSSTLFAPTLPVSVPLCRLRVPYGTRLCVGVGDDWLLFFCLLHAEFIRSLPLAYHAGKCISIKPKNLHRISASPPKPPYPGRFEVTRIRFLAGSVAVLTMDFRFTSFCSTSFSPSLSSIARLKVCVPTRSCCSGEVLPVILLFAAGFSSSRTSPATPANASPL